MHPHQSSDFPSSFVILGEKTSFKREVTLFSSIEDLKDFFLKSYDLKTYQLVTCLHFLLPYSHLCFSESIGHRAQKLPSRQRAKWVVPPAIVGQTHSLIVYVHWAATCVLGCRKRQNGFTQRLPPRSLPPSVGNVEEPQREKEIVQRKI